MEPLYSYQREALNKLSSGKILCGGTGSGKSRVAIAWYFESQGGVYDTEYVAMTNPKDLYIITTAKKRNDNEWLKDLAPFLIEEGPEDQHSVYHHNVIIDSWNNIAKYENAEGAVFIFDEQRVVGSGAWVESFLKIAKANSWILLTATPGDCWLDYAPVFLANGFYKNITEFKRNHVVYVFGSKYPKVDHYINDQRLMRLRDRILVNMDYERPAEKIYFDIFCDWNPIIYKDTIKNRWDPYNNKPLENASSLCYTLRRIVNSDISRIDKLEEIIKEKHRIVIFYNYDYELELLTNYLEFASNNMIFGDDFEYAEYNGHRHQDIPKSKSWIYLVQYNSGAEGWNCITCDTMIFFSQNYSYKMMEQASGRIDRLNTPFKKLYYYVFKSRSSIDISISRALKSKKQFNERKYITELENSYESNKTSENFF